MLTLRNYLRPYKTIRTLLNLYNAQTELIERQKRTIELTEQVGEARLRAAEAKTQLEKAIARRTEPTPQARMVHLEEIERLVDQWIENTSVDTIVAICEEAEVHEEHSPERITELRSMTGVYLCHLWLQAARKRAANQITVTV